MPIGVFSNNILCFNFDTSILLFISIISNLSTYSVKYKIFGFLILLLGEVKGKFNIYMIVIKGIPSAANIVKKKLNISIIGNNI